MQQQIDFDKLEKNMKEVKMFVFNLLKETNPTEYQKLIEKQQEK